MNATERSRAAYAETGYSILPWEGSMYRRTVPRLVVLGDSHYHPEAEFRDDPARHESYSIGIVEDYLAGKRERMHFWTKSLNLLSDVFFGRQLSPDEFYQRITYHNVLVRMLEGFGQTPKPENVRASVDPLRQFIRVASPDIVVMYGGRAPKYLGLLIGGQGAQEHRAVRHDDVAYITTGHPMGTFRPAQAKLWLRHSLDELGIFR